MKQTKVLAYHFTDGMKLRDGQQLKVGRLYKHIGELEMCVSGYHASIDILDALSYAPGFTVSRVECSGKIEQQNDKLVCSQRKALWTLDAKKIILKWSIRTATDAIKRVKKTCNDKAWNAWADLWISGKDRTYATAYATAYTAAPAYTAAATTAATTAATAAATAAATTAAYTAADAATATAAADAYTSAYAAAYATAYTAAAATAAYAATAYATAATTAAAYAATAAATTAAKAKKKYSDWLVSMIEKARMV
jgi:hypothetical protein